MEIGSFGTEVIAGERKYIDIAAFFALVRALT
jgi:hypothetical protein